MGVQLIPHHELGLQRNFNLGIQMTTQSAINMQLSYIHMNTEDHQCIISITRSKAPINLIRKESTRRSKTLAGHNDLHFFLGKKIVLMPHTTKI